MSFKVNGKARVFGNMRSVARQMPDETGRALYHVAQPIMTEAKRLTPVWNPARRVPKGHAPGSLRASGQVHLPERNGNRVSVTLSFGNEIVDYAVYVHEDLEARHATGQAKYLEQPLMQAVPSIPQTVAQQIDLRKMVS